MSKQNRKCKACGHPLTGLDCRNLDCELYISAADAAAIEASRPGIGDYRDALDSLINVMRLSPGLLESLPPMVQQQVTRGQSMLDLDVALGPEDLATYSAEHGR